MINVEISRALRSLSTNSSDRKQNAAAYFLEKALVRLWSTSSELTDLMTTEVKEALSMSDQSGKSWDAKGVNEFLLNNPEDDVSSLYDVHHSHITSEFDSLITEIAKKFEQKTVKGMFNLYRSELKGITDTLSQQVDVVNENYSVVDHNTR